MPSTSKKQHNFMAAVAKNPAFAKKAGVPASVGQDFLNADKGRKFARGGEMKPAMTGLNQAAAMSGRTMPTTGRPATPMKKGGATRADGVATKGKTKGKMIAMKKGGKACK